VHLVFFQLSQLIPTGTWIRLLFVLFLLFVLYLVGQSVFMYADYAYFGNDPFAICGRRCQVYVYHIGPLVVEDRSPCNLPWALTVRTR
jgi:hypothetical protein